MPADHPLVAGHATKSVAVPVTDIEVCQGNDCFGSGGGAVLLELEELVDDYRDRHQSTGGTATAHESRTFHLSRGGCRNFCSMGPNVHVRTRHQNPQHFTQIKGTEECHTLGETIGILSEFENDVTSDSCRIGSSNRRKNPSIHNMLLKRAHRLRWEALREMARFREIKRQRGRASTRSSSMVQALNQQLEAAYSAELSAAKMSDDPDGQGNRTERRFTRFRRTLAEILAEPDRTYSDSDSSSDGEGEMKDS